jgi:UDP-glucose:(heptosyl)LPS alpha-1,3-glucosyltransferase
MKAALVILHADPRRGGAERYTVELARALATRGHEIALLSSDEQPPVIEGVRSVKLAAHGWTRTHQYRQFLASLEAHLAAETYDVVHAMLPVRRCNVYHPHAGIAAAALHRANAMFNPRRRAMADIERQLLAGERPPVTLCLSKYNENNLRHYFPDAPTAMLFNAVDLQKFDQARRPEARAAIRDRFALPEDAVVALMIAQDFERKGLRQAIQATAAVANERLRLVVVGKEPVKRYEKLAARLGVTSRITFAGPTDDPHAFYQAADFFMLPTRHDPCSLVVLEALAMGRPVISTAMNGATEIMHNGEHGFVLSDPGDIEALARAMTLMLDDGARQAMGAACLTLRPSLAYEGHVERLVAIWQERLATTSPSEPK